MLVHLQAEKNGILATKNFPLYQLCQHYIWVIYLPQVSKTAATLEEAISALVSITTLPNHLLHINVVHVHGIGWEAEVFQDVPDLYHT